MRVLVELILTLILIISCASRCDRRLNWRPSASRLNNRSGRWMIWSCRQRCGSGSWSLVMGHAITKGNREWGMGNWGSDGVCVGVCVGVVVVVDVGVGHVEDFLFSFFLLCFISVGEYEARAKSERRERDIMMSWHFFFSPSFLSILYFLHFIFFFKIFFFLSHYQVLLVEISKVHGVFFLYIWF